MNPAPQSFVFKLASDFPKVAIAHGLSQMMIFQHPGDMQILNRYQRVVFAEIAGEFMRGITTDMGNVSRHARDQTHKVMHQINRFMALFYP